MTLTLVALYPLLVHLAVVLNAPALQVVALICFAAGLLYRSLRQGHKKAWGLLAVVSLLALVLGHFHYTLYLLYGPPILLPLLMLYGFGRTLLPGREPLITAIGEAARGPLPQPMRRYTRRLTQIWCAVFFVMMSWSLVLTLLDDPTLWSWFTNVINYGLVGGLFVGEFALRRYLFPTHDHPTFWQYLRIVVNAQARP